MAIKIDPDDLNQGSVLAVASAIFATGTGADIRIHTSAANLLPALAALEIFEVRDHSNAVNNGLYEVVTVNTSTDDYECDKIFGSAPVVAGVEAITTLGATGAATEKSIYWATDLKGVALIEQGNLDVDGVTGQAVFSKFEKDWKSDSYLIDTGDAPMLAIDADAGKFVIGQDNQGNNNGWTWLDSVPFGIRTRKLLRNMGWDEISDAGVLLQSWVGVGTLGSFEDAVNDKARYSFGTDTSVNNSVEFDFAGPVNEAINYYEEQVQPGSLAITLTTTITRTGGSFITEGYKVGGQYTARLAADAGNNGTFTLTAVTALTLVTTGLTNNAADTTMVLAVNNINAIKLRNRIRDADPTGKTYTQANLLSGNYTALRSGFMTFPLSSVSDPNITETDANIDINAPYTGMTLTLHSTPQSLGADLVGGPYNFGAVIVANNGTQKEVLEWVQRQLRKTTNIDAGAGTNIGVMLDDLATFVGAQLQLGISSPTDGSKFFVNPEGGGSGVYITGLNAASKNTTVMFDNLGSQKGFPIGTPVTIDINQIFIDDASAIQKLYFDNTITNAAAGVVVTAGTGANGTFVCTATLPATLNQGVGAYVRVSGLTGADLPMNGVYQVTALTSTSLWSVTRRDAKTIVTTASTAITIDENCIHTPDAIIVDTDNALTATTISFTAPDTIGDTGSGLAIFAIGDFIRVAGTPTNDGLYEVLTSAAGTLTLVEQTILTQAAGGSYTLTELFQHAADADFSATFDYSANTQGGRTGGTDAQVQAKGQGAAINGAQSTISAVRTVESAIALSIALSASLDRNFTP